jgi:hypothetical protein
MQTSFVKCRQLEVDMTRLIAVTFFNFINSQQSAAITLSGYAFFERIK